MAKKRKQKRKKKAPASVAARVAEAMARGPDEATVTLCPHPSGKVSMTAHRGKVVATAGIYSSVDEAMDAAMAHLQFRRFCMVMLSKKTFLRPLGCWLVVGAPPETEVYRLGDGGALVPAVNHVDYENAAVMDVF